MKLKKKKKKERAKLHYLVVAAMGPKYANAFVSV